MSSNCFVEAHNLRRLAAAGTAMLIAVIGLCTAVLAQSCGGWNQPECAPLTLGPPPGAIAQPTQNVDYNQVFTATGGSSGATYVFSATGLPPGLTMSPAGVLSGTPSAAGAYAFAVSVSDGASSTSPVTYAGTINAAASSSCGGWNQPPCAPQTVGPLPGVACGGWNQPPCAPQTVGPLPGADCGGWNQPPCAPTATTGLTLSPPTGPLPSGTVGSNYPDQLLTATGGTGPYTFRVTAGSLPAGLQLLPQFPTAAPTAVVFGTPTAPGAFSFAVEARDALGVAAASQTYTGTIAPVAVPLTLNPPSGPVPNGTAGTAYSPQTLTAAGGAGGPYTFRVSVGSLPAGLLLSPAFPASGPNGTISGTPTTPGPFSFTVEARDAQGAALVRNYTGTIAPAAVTMAILPVGPALLNGTVGVEYSPPPFTVTGGSGNYYFRLSAGSLPPGVTIAPAPTVATVSAITLGKPTFPGGPFDFTIEARDAATGQVTTRNYTISSVVAPPLVLLPNAPALPSGTVTLLNGTVGLEYSSPLFTVTGGSGNYYFRVSSGGLPPGMTLTPAPNVVTGNAFVLGSPTAPGGPFNFTVEARDAATGQATTRNYGIPSVVAPAAPTILHVSDQSVTGVVCTKSNPWHQSGSGATCSTSLSLANLHPGTTAIRFKISFAAGDTTFEVPKIWESPAKKEINHAYGKSCYHGGMSYNASTRILTVKTTRFCKNNNQQVKAEVVSMSYSYPSP